MLGLARLSKSHVQNSVDKSYDPTLLKLAEIAIYDGTTTRGQGCHLKYYSCLEICLLVKGIRDVTLQPKS